MLVTAPVTASAGPSANAAAVPAGLTVKKEPIVTVVQKPGTVTAGTPVIKVKTEPGVTATKSQPITGVPTTASQATGNPASMLTVSALPSMDETVASTRQPLITPLKRKHEDEDDDYDS